MEKDGLANLAGCGRGFLMSSTEFQPSAESNKVDNELTNIDRSLLWELGEDFDCETCGSSWNHAEFDPDFHGISKWRFSYSVGCYYGEDISYESNDVETRLLEMFEVLQNYTSWESTREQTIRAEIVKFNKG